MREAFKGKRGVQFGLNNFLTDLMFADDSAVFANADADAEATNILYNNAHIAQSYGLKINANKTKVITTDGSPANVYLEGIQIEQVEKFKYLGSLLQEKKVASTAEVYRSSNWTGNSSICLTQMVLFLVQLCYKLLL